MYDQMYSMITSLLWIAIPAFTILYLITAYYAGLYDRWYKRSELVRSTLIATIVFTGRLFFVTGTISFFKGHHFIRGHSLLLYLLGMLRMDTDANKSADQQQRK